MILGEIEYEPDMRKTFQSPEGVRVTVLGFENYLSHAPFHITALAGDAELLLEVGPDVCDRFDLHDSLSHLWDLSLTVGLALIPKGA